MARVIRTEVVIDAPVQAVWAVLIDFARHPEWSDSFVLRGAARPGARGRVGFSILGIRLSYPVVLEVMEEPRRLKWRGGPSGLVRGRHYFEVSPLADDATKTRFVHGEEFDGIAVPMLWPLLVRALDSSYDRFNQQLKQRAEGAR
jgi:hypothetical protein